MLSEKCLKAVQISIELRKIYDHCVTINSFDDIMWEAFWDINKDFPFNLDYYDPDTTYEEDMRARLWAVEEYVEGYKSYLESLDENSITAS